MVKGKLERKYKLVYEGRELSSWLSEAGKYDAFQILVQKFDSGIEGAIDPDEVTVVCHNKELPLASFKIIVHKIRVITKCGETRRSNQYFHY